MQRSLFALAAVFLLIGTVLGFGAAPYLAIINAERGECKSPGLENVQSVISPGADGKIIHLIESAENTIHIILFEFSYSDLKEALVLAAARGVRVRLILDPKVSQNLDTADFLEGKGIEVRWSSPRFNYTHAKTMIVDGRRVLSGSINWSRNAMTRNREIGLIANDPKVAGELEGIFESDWADAKDVK